ncbi:MAG: sigma-54-dependent Fis family transcriptional regulator [Rhodocyclaceae bacterium]|nr:MAG: sigma-54-dependent Fis family transcriptional regulator [Rhodocyclaceae bacterium]
MNNLPLCLIEDDEIMGESLCDRFQLEGFAVDWQRTLAGGRTALTARRYGAVISDIRLPDGDGGDLFFELKDLVADAPPFLFITGFGTIDRAVALLKAGAVDYVTKPFDIDRLMEKVREIIPPDTEAPAGAKMTGKLGISPAMQRIEESLPRLAQHASALLITGESGVGKEHVAQLFHQFAHDDEDRPFVAVNCASLPEGLLEAELFGYEKGAFTGAIRLKKGLLEQANGGTLFLDEIGEMSLPMQSKLLRAVQDRRITRIGGDQSIAVDFRLVCATHRDLKLMVVQGGFREDLFYRINVIHLRVPPLRERPEDILHFLRRFLDDFQRIHGGERHVVDARAEYVLLDYPWPGNLRELHNCVERACILSTDRMLGAEAFFEEGVTFLPANATAPTLAEHIARVERDYLVRALARNGSHMGNTAAELGISRKNLWEKMRKLGMRAEPGEEVRDEG